MSYAIIYWLFEKIWGKIEMSTIMILENEVFCFQFRHPKSVEWILSRGWWHLKGKHMLLRTWTLIIVSESFVFNSIPKWIKLGRIPMELWIDIRLDVVASAIGKHLSLDLATKERRKLSFVRVCVELNVESPMLVEVTVNLRRVDFIVTVNYEWKPRKCNLYRAFRHCSGKCPRIVENKVHHEEEVRKVVFNKEDDLNNVACGDVVFESFK